MQTWLHGTNINACYYWAYLPYTPNTWHSYAIWGCVHIYMPHMKSVALTIQQEQCTYIWHISLNKNGCQIPNIAHIDSMLHGHIRPTFYIHVPKQNQLQYLLHITAKYVAETNVAFKKAQMSYTPNTWCAYLDDACAYMCHMWSRW